MSSTPSNAPPMPPRRGATAVPAAPLFTPRFVLLLATQATYGCVYSAFLLLPKYLARELHAGPGAIGWVMSAYVAGGLLVVPWVARALDRRRRGPLMVGGALLGAMTALGFLAVTQVGTLLIALSLLLGVAFVLVFNAGGTLATDLAPPARLGQALGIWGLATLATNAIAPVTLEPVADRWGWDAVFVLAALGALVAAILGAVGTRGEPAPVATAPATTTPPTGSVRSRPGGERARVLLAAALTGVGLGTLFTFVVPYALALGAHRVSGFFLGYTAAAIVVRLGFGSLADRHGRARVSLVGLLAYAAAVAGAAWLTPIALPLIGVALGLTHGVTYPSLNALAVAGAPPAQSGSTMAYYFGAYSLGRSVSVAALGLLAGAAGYPTTFLVAGALLSAGALVLLPLARAERRAAHALGDAERPCPAA